MSSAKTGIVTSPHKRKSSTRGSKNLFRVDLVSAIAPAERLNTGILAIQPPKLDTLPRATKDYSIRYADNWAEISREC